MGPEPPRSLPEIEMRPRRQWIHKINSLKNDVSSSRCLMIKSHQVLSSSFNRRYVVPRNGPDPVTKSQARIGKKTSFQGDRVDDSEVESFYRDSQFG